MSLLACLPILVATRAVLNWIDLDEALEKVTLALTGAHVLYGGCSECFSPKRCPGLEVELERHSTESFG